MKRHDDVEARIGAWLSDEARGELADRVLQATFERTRRSPQQHGIRGWLTAVRSSGRPWAGRSSDMSSLMRLAAVVAVTMLGTAIVLSAARDPETGSGAAPTPSPMAAQPLPTMGVLEPGRYAAETHFGAGIEFTVPEGWNCVGLCANLTLGWGGTGQQLLTVGTFEGRVHVEPCFVPEEGQEGEIADMAMAAWVSQPENTMTIEATPEGLLDHIRANPHLTLAQDGERAVDDHQALQLDVIATTGDGCHLDSTFVWHEGAAIGARLLVDGTQARFTAIDVDGRVVVVTTLTARDAGDHQAMLRAAGAVLDSMSLSWPEVD